jgi:FKBP-type peptidyl-prolyl cis-trans isomerase 2
MCPNCGEYDWKSKHKCRPEWQAIYVDWNDVDDPAKAFGSDAEQAVEQFAGRNFSNWDYPDEMEIWVRKPGDNEWQKFEVTVESVPEFTATAL